MTDTITATEGANVNLEGQNEVRTYTEEEVQKLLQSESDKRVTEALKTAKKGFEEEQKKREEELRSELERQAKLSASEKEKEERERKDKELQDTKEELRRVYLEQNTVQKLTEENIPITFKNFLMGSDEKDTEENIKNFKIAYEKEVQKQVEERLKGKTPDKPTPPKEFDVWESLAEKYK